MFMAYNSFSIGRSDKTHRVTAVLGPTNTGKTTLAIDRMLASPSGLIGLPLRLLAREVYGRLVERAGVHAVGLITGEEKIKPRGARYWVSTVEAMPPDLDVSFLAIDEVQIAADLERGHVFTDRILNSRGRDETMLLGAATMRPLIEKLLPDALILTRPRLSNLTFAGQKKLTRLPRRSAIVAFSADEVYAIAELIRRQSGGAAVVLGALSPRTRNAQVALYQAGDVDYLVATDAIGMGLNLDIEHIAFAGDRKFDGYQFRRLNPVEMAQIAGRAGRSNRDGTFGTTGRCEPFEEELVHALEAHSFDGVKMLQWRNSNLDFTSIDTLRGSLDVIPRHPVLTRAPIAEDQRVLDLMLKDPTVSGLTAGRDGVRRLWEACMMPDYRKISPASHGDLVATIYRSLMKRGHIPADWLAAQVAFADRTDGDIDTLSTRIAHIRTWTFAANRADWVADPHHWQGITRGIEDKLSDALHERLTQRFVDRRTSVLMRRLREKTMLEAEVTKSGDVLVEGQHVGRLEGFQFTPDATAGDGDAGRALRTAAAKALAGEIEMRAERLSNTGDDSFILASNGVLRWQGEAVARLVAGDRVLAPRMVILSDEHLTGPAREKVQARLDLWMAARIEKYLGPVLALEKAEDVTGLARGIAFQLSEALGILDRNKVAKEVKELDQEARAALRKLGVRFGAYHLYLPATLKPAPRALALQLYALKHGGNDLAGVDELPLLASSGRTSIAVNPAIRPDQYAMAGFRVLGARAVRVDILERLADIIRPALAWRPLSPGTMPEGAFPGGGFTVTVQMTSLCGCAGEDFSAILRGLGYRMDKKPAPVVSIATAEAEGTTEPAPETAAQEIGAEEIGAEVIATESPVSESTVEPVADEAAPEILAEAEVPALADAAAEPAMVEVWRPGNRHEGEKRPPRRDFRRPDAKASNPSQGQGDGAQAAPAEGGERKRFDRRPAKDLHQFGKPRHGKDDKRRDDRGGPRPAMKEQPPRKEREPDPNSPFAKLMALKLQMEKK